MARCKSTYGNSPTLNGRPIRCELHTGHDGEHGHSFAARYWTDDPTECCGVPSADPCASWCVNALDDPEQTAATDADIAARHAAYHGAS